MKTLVINIILTKAEGAKVLILLRWLVSLLNFVFHVESGMYIYFGLLQQYYEEIYIWILNINFASFKLIFHLCYYGENIYYSSHEEFFSRLWGKRERYLPTSTRHSFNVMYEQKLKRPAGFPLLHYFMLIDTFLM